MAQIIRLRNAWYSDFRIDGKRVNRFLDTNKQFAMVKLGELMAKLRAERSGTGYKDIQWDDFKTKYLEYSRSQKRPETVKRDIAALAILEKFDDPPITHLRQLTPELLDRVKAKRMNGVLSPSTINRDISAIKAMLKKAVAWKYIEPLEWASVKPLKEPRGRLLFYSKDEFKRLRASCRGVWETILMLGARAGLRRGEIYMLEWQDVDLARMELHIEPKEGWAPKDYERRTVPILSGLDTHLRGLRRRSRWVLGDDRPSLAVMSAYFKKIVRRVKLKGSLHTLRHTFASHMAQDGVSLYTLAKWLGHENVKTTQIYAKLCPASYEVEARKVSPL